MVDAAVNKARRKHVVVVLTAFLVHVDEIFFAFCERGAVFDEKAQGGLPFDLWMPSLCVSANTWCIESLLYFFDQSQMPEESPRV